jgi:translation initiation factor IF-2
LKAKEALEAGRVADEKLLAQDSKRQEMTRLQKEEAEGLKKQQEQAKQQTLNLTAPCATTRLSARFA